MRDYTIDCENRVTYGQDWFLRLKAWNRYLSPEGNEKKGIYMEIFETLDAIKSSTWAVMTRLNSKDIFRPTGTGFMIHNSGFFITARHVLERDDQSPNGNEILPLLPSENIQIKKPYHDGIGHPRIVQDWPLLDLALLKIEPTGGSCSAARLDFSLVREGEQVYSFGYPLGSAYEKTGGDQNFSVSGNYFFPRVTSAIVASQDDVMGPIRRQTIPNYYVIDKALNYGNSGGPIVRTANGAAFAVCSRFQPVAIPQGEGRSSVFIPSLYGIAVSLAPIQGDLHALGALAEKIIFL